MALQSDSSLTAAWQQSDRWRRTPADSRYGSSSSLCRTCTQSVCLRPAAFVLCAVPGHAPLLPRLWSDPYAIASVLHGAWRAYVVASGMYYAYTIYASINKGIMQQQLVQTRPYRRLGSSSSSGSFGPPPPGGRVQQQGIGPVQPLRHHLSLSLPVAGSGGGAAAGGSSSSGRVGLPCPERVDGSLLHTIRERFDKATMVQVRVWWGCWGAGRTLWVRL